MTDVQVGLAAMASLLGLIALRVPIGVALIAVSFLGIWVLMGWTVAWGALSVIPYQFAANWVLSSVPMFLLLGYICYHSKLTFGLFRAARIWLSGVPGGLAIAAVFGASGFAAVCGSSVACAAAMGRIAIPEMIRHRYQAELATGTVAAAGTIGALIPPSIIMILYGIVAQTSVPDLFLGGVAAGLLTAASYILIIYLRVKFDPSLAPDLEDKFTLGDKIEALKDTWPVILIMVGIFGGMFAGVFTATEAGAVGAFLAFIVAAIKGALSWEVFRNSVVETLLTTGALLIIAVGASLLVRFLALSGAGQSLSAMIISLEAGQVLVLLSIVVIYLLLGMFLEPIGAMLLTLPIVLPVIGALNLSLVWFGVILTKLLEIGMLTPPIGMNVFVIKGVVGNSVSTTGIFKGVLWFLVMDAITLAFMMIYPEFILYLPRQVLG